MCIAQKEKQKKNIRKGKRLNSVIVASSVIVLYPHPVVVGAEPLLPRYNSVVMAICMSIRTQPNV